MGFFLPLSSIAQQIAVNEEDRFTKQRIIETSVVLLKSNTTEGLALQLRSEGTKIYVVLTGQGRGATTIGADDKALLLLANDRVLTVQSTGIQSFQIDKNKSVYKHQYSLSSASWSNWPGCIFRDAAKNNFPQAHDFYECKVVRVRGRVSLYNGKPEIRVSKPEQIDF